MKIKRIISSLLSFFIMTSTLCLPISSLAVEDYSYKINATKSSDNVFIQLEDEDIAQLLQGFRNLHDGLNYKITGTQVGETNSCALILSFISQTGDVYESGDLETIYKSEIDGYEITVFYNNYDKDTLLFSRENAILVYDGLSLYLLSDAIQNGIVTMDDVYKGYRQADYSSLVQIAKVSEQNTDITVEPITNEPTEPVTTEPSESTEPTTATEPSESTEPTTATEPTSGTEATEPSTTAPTEPTTAKTEVTLKKSADTIYLTGTTKISATVKNGKGITTYKSSNSKVAKVSKTGVVTGLKAGKATITVTNNGVSKKFTITIKKPALNKKTLSLKAKKSFALKITGKVGKATFTSSNKKIATVNSKGKIVAKKKGKATITVKTNGIKLTCKVTVK